MYIIIHLYTNYDYIPWLLLEFPGLIDVPWFPQWSFGLFQSVQPAARYIATDPEDWRSWRTDDRCWEIILRVLRQIRLRSRIGSGLGSILMIAYINSYISTSSTAQGGGGSFKNRKPIGEVGCCESGMAERIHWWTERCLRSPLFRSLSLTTYLPIYLLCIYLSISLSLSLSSVYLSSCLPVDLFVYLSIYLSLCLCLSLSLAFICLSV